MAASQLIFRRDGLIHITSGVGRDRLVDVARRSSVLRSVVADDYVFELSNMALWSAAARGFTGVDVLRDLAAAAAGPIPQPVAARVTEVMARWGRLRLEQCDGSAVITASDAGLLRRLGLSPQQRDSRWVAPVDESEIGELKIAAMTAGWPVADGRAIHARADPYRVTATLRPYQREAVSAFLVGGSGLVLLPCGAGKTIVGVAAAAAIGGSTLVLSPSRTVSEQWLSAFVGLSNLSPERVSAHARSIGAERVMIVTYHAATTGRVRDGLRERHWDLVIYDEVQSLPADVFRLAAAFQSSRRLGLTATLVREDGREDEISALVGPALYDVSWLELERQGWIAPARCVEVRIPEAPTARERLRYRLAVLKRLLAIHRDDPVIVAGTHVAGLRRAGEVLGFPVLTGQSDRGEREAVLARFREGDIPVLGISRIGTVGIDLPNASVLIQISGTFGSRQEEAQRLGRVLRPAPGKSACFYTLVACGTSEEGYAVRRQRFLVSQGYQYELLDAASVPRSDVASGDLARK